MKSNNFLKEAYELIDQLGYGEYTPNKRIIEKEIIKNKSKINLEKIDFKEFIKTYGKIEDDEKRGFLINTIELARKYSNELISGALGVAVSAPLAYTFPNSNIAVFLSGFGSAKLANWLSSFTIKPVKDNKLSIKLPEEDSIRVEFPVLHSIESGMQKDGYTFLKENVDNILKNAKLTEELKTNHPDLFRLVKNIKKDITSNETRGIIDKISNKNPNIRKIVRNPKSENHNIELPKQAENKLNELNKIVFLSCVLLLGEAISEGETL